MPVLSRRQFAYALTLPAFAQAQAKPAAAPLFRDPIYDGAADPVVIWHRQERCWWMMYTQRRANVDGPGVAWCHGGDIGVARSFNDGATWTYMGVLPGLEFERGRNTFWAPEIVFYGGQYHMFCSYVPGVPKDWNAKRFIVRYTSPDLWKWTCHGPLPLSSEKVIDACVERVADGLWRLWYKDETKGSHTWMAESPDLVKWSVRGEAMGNKAHEGPNVFRWRNAWWMITDHWDGLEVFRSDDATKWEYQANILREPGKRNEDGVKGGHADVLVQGEDAWIFYFTHPQRPPQPAPPPSGVPGMEPYATRRTSIQVAKLELLDGRVACRRDEPFAFRLQPGEDNWSRFERG